MKSYEFILERQIKPYKFQNLEVEKAVQTLNKYCSESLALIYNPIWRGMRHRESIVKIDPTTGTRASQNTSNHYTQLIDHSPYFKGWPKRSKSLICSTSGSYASDFGAYQYAIFSFNGVKIAVCPGDDIWNTQLNIPEINATIYLGGDDSLIWFLHELSLPDNYEAMIKKIKTPNFRNILYRICQNLEYTPIEPNQLIPAIQRALAPQNSGFRLFSILEMAKSPPINREVWIGGPVIALREDIYEAFLSAVNKQNSLIPNEDFTLY